MALRDTGMTASRTALAGVAVATVAGAATATLPSASLANDAWPAAVNARYRLLFAGVEVGKSDIQSETSAAGYKLSGTSRLSVLLGAFKIQTSGSVSGSFSTASSGAAPQPKSYAFDWQGGKKKGAIRMAFDGGLAKPTSIEPPVEPHPDRIPLKPEHQRNIIDPITAIMVLTRGDGKPCEKRAQIFDGKHRFDVAFSMKGQRPIPNSAKPGKSAAPEMGIVCRVTYTPIAGHKQRAETDSFAQNKDMDVLLRRIPGTDMMIPHTVTIPTGWGTASMIAEKVEVTSARIGKVAWND